MAFDQATRKRLSDFVNEARAVLEEEFARQLQNDYGMDPNSGTVAELTSLRHINDSQRETARILRDTLAHYTASGDINAAQGLDRIVREQAFTVLNRLAALRMAEARGLLVESVGNGFQAKGFQLYARLAGIALGETGDAFRVYLFSVFDELAQDLPALFDRYSPQGRLFPRETALLQVLNLINDAELAPLWSEDETIGWIYQYFNSREERKAMRDASQAPRNSRELAVRNQFFTPRYVVEFLVDNTLGRLWFNTTGGATSLRGRCQYLLVKPDETLQAAIKLRDPRTLKLLDPACGSMHFGLYAFDLFREIYREAWTWEQQHGPGSLDVSNQPRTELKPLSQTYESEEAFLRDVPRLIIEHNIYGVDIDPRAAQIASLALWLRAQRAWHDAGVKVKNRPLIGPGHVVAAIAPPAERELRDQFSANLDKRDAELFEKTLQLLKSLPEMGVLLQVERELPHLIRQAYVGKGTGLFADQEQESWQQAEERLREALTGFAQAAKSTYQGRLFAQDALQGLRLIDLCREAFDVVVMNPPFGDPVGSGSERAANDYLGMKHDLSTAFIDRAQQLCREGYIGVLTTRTPFFLTYLTKWRERLIRNVGSVTYVDLGQGVLDALVETAVMCIEPRKGLSRFASVSQDSEARSVSLRNLAKTSAFFSLDIEYFGNIDRSPFIYWVGESVLKLFSTGVPIRNGTRNGFIGALTQDDFRFTRLWWEVPGREHEEYPVISKAGTYQPYVGNLMVRVNWKNEAKELKAFLSSYRESKGFSAHWTAQLNGYDQYFKRGITWSSRPHRVGSFWALPEGAIFGNSGPAIIDESNEDIYFSLGVLNSPTYLSLLNLLMPRGTEGDGQTLKYELGYVCTVPFPSVTNDIKALISGEAHKLCEILMSELSRLELSTSFSTESFVPEAHSFNAAYSVLQERRTNAKARISVLSKSINDRVRSAYSETANADVATLRNLESTIEAAVDRSEHFAIVEKSKKDFAEDCISMLIGLAFGRYDPSMETLALTDPLAPIGVPKNRYSHAVLSDDPSQDLNIVYVGMEAFAKLKGANANRFVEELEAELGESPNILAYIRKEFFTMHLQRFSAARRGAPIYWPLSVSSGKYTIWLYYSALDDQTLYRAINDFVEPKLKQVSADVTALRTKGSARTRDDEKHLETLQAFELELIEMRDILLKLAPTYKPNRDDGVQISAAPLWPLLRHKPWQKVLKETWAKLEKGDYDWAHLAMNYWPERVREKCKTDRSLAITHDLEQLYIEPEDQPKKTRGKKKVGGGE